jgi:delta 1-pyrroline-5-carboxylate dehydrogenase
MGKGEAVVETQPIGVLLAIEPWNYPFYQVVRVAGPNLVLGNTVILKHAEITPQCAVAIEQLLHRRRGAGGRLHQHLPAHRGRRAGRRRPRDPGRDADRQRAGRQRRSAPWPAST